MEGTLNLKTDDLFFSQLFKLMSMDPGACEYSFYYFLICERGWYYPGTLAVYFWVL